MTDFFVHEKGICESENVGAGTRVWGFAHVLKGAAIGKRCNVGAHVFVENQVNIGDGCTIKNGVALWDGVTLEADVFVGPYAVFTNELRPRAFIKRPSKFLATLIKRGATLGANCTIVCGTVVGEYAMVAAGAVVIEDVPPHTLVVGNPARGIGKICYCGTRLNDNDFCRDCGTLLADNSAAKATSRHSEG